MIFGDSGNFLDEFCSDIQQCCIYKWKMLDIKNDFIKKDSRMT